jgi:hypothetical protein
MKVLAEFRTQFEFETDSEAIDLQEEQAWDKFSQLARNNQLEFDMEVQSPSSMWKPSKE